MDGINSRELRTLVTSGALPRLVIQSNSRGQVIVAEGERVSLVDLSRLMDEKVRFLRPRWSFPRVFEFEFEAGRRHQPGQELAPGAREDLGRLRRHRAAFQRGQRELPCRARTEGMRGCSHCDQRRPFFSWNSLSLSLSPAHAARRGGHPNGEGVLHGPSADRPFPRRDRRLARHRHRPMAARVSGATSWTSPGAQTLPDGEGRCAWRW